MHTSSNHRLAGRLRRVMAVGALAAAGLWAGSAMASTCTNTSSLTLAGLPPTQTFGMSYNSGATFAECWDFNLATAADVSGSTTETQASFWFLPRFIDVQSVELWNLGLGTQVDVADMTPETFSFTSLAAGSYELVVKGYASLGFGTASFDGSLTAVPTGTVPEPPASALALLALGAAAWARRKGPGIRS